jgi:hypothetical protein
MPPKPLCLMAERRAEAKHRAVSQEPEIPSLGNSAARGACSCSHAREGVDRCDSGFVRTLTRAATGWSQERHALLAPRGDLLLYPVAGSEAVARAGLIRKHGTRMDLADAGVVRLSAMFPEARVITTDVDDFRVYRRNRNQTIPLFHP